MTTEAPYERALILRKWTVVGCMCACLLAMIGTGIRPFNTFRASCALVDTMAFCTQVFFYIKLYVKA